jgi:BirA family transcriptional regulator, biotin operon repressor / biotin---[acetyl-CoA-carboxylase] ligase
VSARLGMPRLHLRATDSTNDRARRLAAAGTPHGTLVTAGEQSDGRERQGRTWSTPAGGALLMSLVLREVPELLTLAAAVAVADVAGAGAAIKWPNDILLAGGGKVAGILAEARPQDGWAVLGIGLNVAVRVEDLPAQLHGRAATLGLEPGDVEAVLAALLDALQVRLPQKPAALLSAYRRRDALRGRQVRWQHGHGIAAGIDTAGRLLVDRDDGVRTTLDAGEVHLQRSS